MQNVFKIDLNLNPAYIIFIDTGILIYVIHGLNDSAAL